MHWNSLQYIHLFIQTSVFYWGRYKGSKSLFKWWNWFWCSGSGWHRNILRSENTDLWKWWHLLGGGCQTGMRPAIPPGYSSILGCRCTMIPELLYIYFSLERYWIPVVQWYTLKESPDPGICGWTLDAACWMIPTNPFANLPPWSSQACVYLRYSLLVWRIRRLCI